MRARSIRRVGPGPPLDPDGGPGPTLHSHPLRFVLYGTFGDGTAEQFREGGHVAVKPAELDLDAAADPLAVREAARKQQYELVVADRQTLDALLPKSAARETFGRVLVFLRDDPADHALAVLRLFERYKRLTPGRLYTVSSGRVKVDQLPGLA